MVSLYTTLIPSLELRTGPGCEAGLSAGMRRERVQAQKRRKKESPQHEVWVYFDAVFNRQKTQTVTMTRFYGSITKRSLEKQCKSYSKIHGQTKGGGRTIMNSPLLMWSQLTVDEKRLTSGRR